MGLRTGWYAHRTQYRYRLSYLVLLAVRVPHLCVVQQHTPAKHLPKQKWVYHLREGGHKGATLLSCSDSSGRESVPRQHAIPEAIPYPEATESKLPGDLSESEIAHACRVGRLPISIDLQMPCTLLRFSRGLAELCSSHQTARAGLKET